MQDFARLALERVAAKVLVLFLDLAEARQDLVHVVGAIRIGHRLVEPLELVVQRPDAAAAGNRLVEHAAAGHLLDVLSKVANGQALGTETSPSSGVSSPVIIRKSVVLPAPFGPTRPTFSPGLSWNEVSTKRTCRPYCLLTREKAIMAMLNDEC